LKKFVLKGLLLIGICAAISVVAAFSSIYIIGNVHEGDYTGCMIDKVQRLESIHQPKIILVGNSNLSFGIHSEMIEEEFGMPVVNLGFHGGVGNAFHENVARINIEEGDIVIVCHSNYSDDNTIFDIMLAWNTIEYHSDLWKILRTSDIPDMAGGYPKYVFESAMIWVRGHANMTNDSCYSRSAFNEYGDVVYKPEDGSDIYKIFNDSTITAPQVNDVCAERLNELNRTIKGKGATLLIAGYPIGRGEGSPPESEYVSFQKDLEAAMDCDVISNFTDYFYPYEYFYNTTLHLTEQGATVRTEQLIKDLHRWMENQ
jgi:hypothetical protein